MNELCANCGKEKQNHVERNGHVKCVPEYSEFKSSGRVSVPMELIETAKRVYLSLAITGRDKNLCDKFYTMLNQIDGKE